METYHIIYFEGLFGVFFKWLYRGLIQEIKKQHPNIKIESRHWTNREIINDKKAIVISHSFGANAANRNARNVALLVTLDCRNGFNRKYISRAKCLHLNFYQKKPLRGYPINGAFDVELIGTSHLGIVKDATVHNFVLGNIADLLKG